MSVLLPLACCHKGLFLSTVATLVAKAIVKMTNAIFQCWCYATNVFGICNNWRLIDWILFWTFKCVRIVCCVLDRLQGSVWLSLGFLYWQMLHLQIAWIWIYKQHTPFPLGDVQFGAIIVSRNVLIIGLFACEHRNWQIVHPLMYLNKFSHMHPRV